MDLDSVAGDLYGLAPDEFVAARTAAEKQARAGGDRDLAAQIRRLAKPTTVAWLVNRLVREHPAEIGQLMELGAGLRKATATLSGEQLRTLSQRQHRVIHALVQQTRRVGAAAGHPVSEATARGVEETLRAALADRTLADQLASGRLAGRLEHVGFAPVTGDKPQPRASSNATRATKNERPASDDAQQRRQADLRRAEQDVEDATVASAEAAAAHRDAKAAFDSSHAAVGELAGTLQQLKERLERTTQDHQAAERAEREARAARDRAERTARHALGRLEQARARRAELSAIVIRFLSGRSRTDRRAEQSASRPPP